MEQSTESDLLSRSEPPGMAHENEFEKFARLISTVPECELSDLVRNVKVGEERSTENHLKASDPLIDYSADCSDFINDVRRIQNAVYIQMLTSNFSLDRDAEILQKLLPEANVTNLDDISEERIGHFISLAKIAMRCKREVYNIQRFNDMVSCAVDFALELFCSSMLLRNVEDSSKAAQLKSSLGKARMHRQETARQQQNEFNCNAVLYKFEQLKRSRQLCATDSSLTFSPYLDILVHQSMSALEQSCLTILAVYGDEISGLFYSRFLNMKFI